jgi:hypothetical protein
MAAKASGVFGLVYQKMTVTASAPRLASQARSQGRSSTRLMERARTTKKMAMVSDDAICAVVLQRQSSSSIPLAVGRWPLAVGSLPLPTLKCQHRPPNGGTGNVGDRAPNDPYRSPSHDRIWRA